MRKTLHVVYWRDPDGIPRCIEHESLDAMLKTTEALRGGGLARFICSSTESIDLVGEQGATVMRPEDYKWFKRRPDPEIPLGRDPSIKPWKETK